MHMEQPLHSHAGQADLHAHHPFPGGLPPADILQLDGIGILNRHLRMGLREHVNLVPPLLRLPQHLRSLFMVHILHPFSCPRL